jgi:rare lipoprotein A
VPGSAGAWEPPAQAHYLQLGAFSSAANAEAALAHLRRQVDWLQVPIEMQAAGDLYRVQAGPYALREQAARAGAEVASRTGLRPLLLPRQH